MTEDGNYYRKYKKPDIINKSYGKIIIDDNNQDVYIKYKTKAQIAADRRRVLEFLGLVDKFKIV